MLCSVQLLGPLVLQWCMVTGLTTGSSGLAPSLGLSWPSWCMSSPLGRPKSRYSPDPSFFFHMLVTSQLEVVFVAITPCTTLQPQELEWDFCTTCLLFHLLSPACLLASLQTHRHFAAREATNLELFWPHSLRQTLQALHPFPAGPRK